MLVVLYNINCWVPNLGTQSCAAGERSLLVTRVVILNKASWSHSVIDPARLRTHLRIWCEIQMIYHPAQLITCPDGASVFVTLSFTLAQPTELAIRKWLLEFVL